MHARVVLGVGKGVLFREVTSVQECPDRERGSTVYSILKEPSLSLSLLESTAADSYQQGTSGEAPYISCRSPHYN